jgi:peptidoglycan/xylan/chitin deacetylase (PgdA/CDA1 family)
MHNQTRAKYLLRFDDLCPTMNWEIWAEIEALLLALRIKPLLAVIPDNREAKFNVGPAANDFWDRVRAWQERGWTIGLHGYQHLYVSANAGLVATRRKSEFAGLPTAAQEEKLRRGMEIFQREAIRTETWVAPGNTFDAVTVSLLPRFGIRIISDGNFHLPYLARDRIFWIPQQLFHFRPAPAGIWTVCFHHNVWSEDALKQFRENVIRYQHDIVSVSDVVELYGERQSAWSEWLCMRPRLSRLLIRGHLKLWSWRENCRNPRPLSAPAPQPTLLN